MSDVISQYAKYLQDIHEHEYSTIGVKKSIANKILVAFHNDVDKIINSSVEDIIAAVWGSKHIKKAYLNSLNSNTKSFLNFLQKKPDHLKLVSVNIDGKHVDNLNSNDFVKMFEEYIGDQNYSKSYAYNAKMYLANMLFDINGDIGKISNLSDEDAIKFVEVKDYRKRTFRRHLICFVKEKFSNTISRDFISKKKIDEVRKSYINHDIVKKILECYSQY